jgi:N-dimethylarginine dimethylaminohydrolase
VANHPRPAEIQQLRPINHGTMTREYAAIMAAFSDRGVRVATIDPTPLGPGTDYCFNMMYCRDLLFMTPRGAIMAAMANPTRRGEVPYAARTLERLGVPILHTVSGDGRFEGADALWLRHDLVIVGVGNRTNREAFHQLATVLAGQGVTCIPLPSRQTKTQHLLGSLQLVDRDLALVRGEIIDPAVTAFLQGEGYRVVELGETGEIRERQAMNIVTVAPRTIFMTAGCPETKRIYRQAGLEVAAELEISQLINGAGGLACATGIIARI